ncbi:MAG: ABC transporter ATP-binding protein [Gammaproteobacteria bacterium]|nr:ABC transporter ATP-binding protein [Gammaproteobacteria bacterium]
MAEVRLQCISKSFGASSEICAVRDLDLRIGHGEFVVLLGPTGAGKTTTLRLTAGLESPDAGRVFIDGDDVTAHAPSLRDVAFVFQQYSLYPHYTVFDNMAFPLRAPGRGLSAAAVNRRVAEVAEMLRIADKLDNKATELSGGEMQRVSIGRALVRAPKVFLMDEPLSSLDAKLREDLRVELKRIQRDLGATMLYVTHDPLEAMTLADRIGILHHGELAQIGSPKSVYESPRNIHAARRLGSPPLNLVEAGTAGMAARSARAKTIGVRPEEVRIDRANGAPARVLNIEHLGGESIATLRVGEQTLQGFLPDRMTLAAGDEVFFSAGKTMEFDENGDAIFANTHDHSHA